jgi:hypothetical protein
MRRFALVLAVLAVAGMTASAAQGVSVHFKGDHSLPTFNDQGLVLSMTGVLAGLGNYDTAITLTATGQPTADCVNPGSGEHRPPGQQPAEVTLVGTTLVSASDIKNGNVSITVTTGAPTTPVPGAPGCPNSNWTENITEVSFSSATFTVVQDSNANGAFEEAPSLSGSCTFSPSTSNGAVPGASVSC